jgi:hypothetical protein
MPPSKLNRASVIEQLCEQRDTLARLVGAPKLEPLIKMAIHLSRQKVEELMARDLDSAEWETLERSELVEGLKDIRAPQLEQVRQRVKRWTDRILSQPEYIYAVEAYQNQDGRGGPLFRRSLNQFLDKFAYSELDIAPDAPLYHGVEATLTADFEVAHVNGNGHKNGHTNGKSNGNGSRNGHANGHGSNGHANGNGRAKLMSPTAYVDILQGIVQNGLKANPTMENLPQMDSAFAVSHPIASYGLAGVRFNLGEDKAWGRTHNPIEGVQIVKPVVKKPFMVYLKSPDFLDLPEDQECMGSQKLFQSLDIGRYMDYQMRLEEELAKRGIEYVIVDPDGVEV